MTAYGVASRSMAFYGTFDFTARQILRSVFYPVYYLLYTNLSGELNGLDGRLSMLIDVTCLMAIVQIRNRKSPVSPRMRYSHFTCC